MISRVIINIMKNNSLSQHTAPKTTIQLHCIYKIKVLNTHYYKLTQIQALQLLISVSADPGRTRGGCWPHPPPQPGQRGQLPGVRSPLGLGGPHLALAPAPYRGRSQVHWSCRPS